MVQQKHPLVELFLIVCVNLLLLLPYCFKLPLCLCLIRFGRFNHETYILQLLHLINQPWNLKIEQPATYLCPLTVAHPLFAFHPLPPAPSCLASLLYLSTILSLFLASPGLFSFILPLQLSISIPPPFSSSQLLLHPAPVYGACE